MARLLISAAMLLATHSVAHAEDLVPTFVEPAAPTRDFGGGFAELYEQLGRGVMGWPVEPERQSEDAEAVQLTTHGIAVWRKGEQPQFHDGVQTYTLQPTLRIASVASNALGPPIFGAIGQARCIIGKESGGLDVPNAQGSPARGPGQYFPGTWDGHVALYRQATGYQGPLSLHSLRDVEAVMSYVLTLPKQRTHWVVGGC